MEKEVIYEIDYNKTLDILRIYEKGYDPKETSFYQFENFPIYIITENNIIIGIEFFDYKNSLRDFYKSKKKELNIGSIKSADEFLRGGLYSFYKAEFSGAKVTKHENRILEIKNPITQKKMIENLEELVPA